MKVSVNIPTSLTEITLQQYQNWIKISEGNDDVYFLQQKMIEVFCNIPLIAVNKMKTHDVESICNSIVELFDSDTKFKDRIKIDNIEFGFIPKLDDITFGEYVDLDNYLSDWSNIHKGLGVLYRPVTNSVKQLYEIEDYETSEKYDMTKIDMNTVFSSLVFFYNLSNELKTVILNYLKTQEGVGFPQHLLTSVKNGLGINLYMDYQKETYQVLKKLLKLKYTVA